jgi:N-ethylmaleimide reductase
MNRSRAELGGIPTPIMATYFAQRASAGLLISDATHVSPMSVSSLNAPCLYSEAHVNGWRRVTDAVHRAGGRIFVQIRHVGRVSHPSRLPNGTLPIAPSSIAALEETFTPDGPQPFPTPRVLSTEEIGGVVDEFRLAAEHGLRAGFDGVEIHAANGYLIDQFLRDGSNQRTDCYGGFAANRVRFLLEITEAVVEVWSAARVGVRLSPHTAFGDMRDSDPVTTFLHAAAALNRFGLAYLHLIEGVSGSECAPQENAPRLARRMRTAFGGSLIINGSYTRPLADEVIASGEADLVSFGVPFLANPDLPERLRSGKPLNSAATNRFYGGNVLGYTNHSEDARGYTDYPTLGNPSLFNHL